MPNICCNTPSDGLHEDDCPVVLGVSEVDMTIWPESSVPDMVNHPPHYTAHPSGIECIQITEHMGFNVGNAVKYLWRADEKGNAIEDLEKAKWYVERELKRRRAHESA